MLFWSISVDLIIIETIAEFVWVYGVGCAKSYLCQIQIKFRLTWGCDHFQIYAVIWSLSLCHENKLKKMTNINFMSSFHPNVEGCKIKDILIISRKIVQYTANRTVIERELVLKKAVAM